MGKGATATVYEGLYTQPKEVEPDPTKRQIQVAVKKIDKDIVNEALYQVMEKEFEVIGRLKNKNIVDFKKLYRSSNNYYYVYELVRGADLKDRLKTKGRFTEFECQGLFR